MCGYRTRNWPSKKTSLRWGDCCVRHVASLLMIHRQPPALRVIHSHLWKINKKTHFSNSTLSPIFSLLLQFKKKRRRSLSSSSVVWISHCLKKNNNIKTYGWTNETIFSEKNQISEKRTIFNFGRFLYTNSTEQRTQLQHTHTHIHPPR
jgi:hypothetical protein